jgi:YVTN family beta-propeller protein
MSNGAFGVAMVRTYGPKGRVQPSESSSGVKRGPDFRVGPDKSGAAPIGDSTQPSQSNDVGPTPASPGRPPPWRRSSLKLLSFARRQPLIAVPRNILSDIRHHARHGVGDVVIAGYASLIALLLLAITTVFLRDHLPAVYFAEDDGVGRVPLPTLVGFLLAWAIGWSLIITGGSLTRARILLPTALVFAWYTNGVIGIFGWWATPTMLLIALVLLRAFAKRWRPVPVRATLEFSSWVLVIGLAFLPLIARADPQHALVRKVSWIPFYLLLGSIPFWALLSFAVVSKAIKYAGAAVGSLGRRHSSTALTVGVWSGVALLALFESAVFFGAADGPILVMTCWLVILELVRRTLNHGRTHMHPWLFQPAIWAVMVVETAGLAALAAFAVVSSFTGTFLALSGVVPAGAALAVFLGLLGNRAARGRDWSMLYRAAYTMVVIFAVQTVFSVGLGDPGGNIQKGGTLRVSLFFVLTAGNLLVFGNRFTRQSSPNLSRVARVLLFLGCMVLLLGALNFNLFAVDYSTANYPVAAFILLAWAPMMTFGVPPYMLWLHYRRPQRFSGERQAPRALVRPSITWRRPAILACVAAVAACGMLLRAQAVYRDPGRIVLAALASTHVGHNPGGIAASPGVVWVTSYSDGTVSRLDEATDRVIAVIEVGRGPLGVGVDRTSVWIANADDDSVTRINLLTNEPDLTVQVGSTPVDVAIDGATVWVINAGDGTVSRIDAVSGRVMATIGVGDTPSAVAARNGRVWVTNWADGTLSEIDPATNDVTSTLNVGYHPFSVAADGEGAWVASRSEDSSTSVHRVEPRSPLPNSPLVSRALSIPGLENAFDLFVAETGAVWISGSPRGLYVLDGTTRELLATGDVPAGRISVAHGFAWITDFQGDTAIRIGWH